MSRPLNFLHLTTFYPPYSFGGDALQIYRLSHALADLGHRVDVVHCVDAYRLLHPAPPPLEYPEHPGVVRHELRSPFTWLSPLLTQQTGRMILKRRSILELLRQRDYDVIHFHNISLLGPEVLSIEPAKQAVKLYTAHEHWLVCPMHVLWKFNQRPCEKPECLQCSIKARRPPQLWRYTGMLSRMAQHVDRFLAPSRFTARMHAERGFKFPMTILPNFIARDDSDWQSRPTRPQERPYFLFVGRLEAIKGLQTLIRIWNRAPDADLLVAGAGDYEPQLRAMAAPDPRIKFLGPLPQRELGALYYHAIACLVPSITYETFGLTSVEAFARKTPAVVRDLGALPEVIEESGGGFAYRTDEDLLGLLHRLSGSPALRADLGQNGYDAFLRLWSREAHLAQYLGYIAEIASKKFGRDCPFRLHPE
jgi:glycosyltransferase involved in cell wall biosynthesis